MHMSELIGSSNTVNIGDLLGRNNQLQLQCTPKQNEGPNQNEGVDIQVVVLITVWLEVLNRHFQSIRHTWA